MGRKHHSEGSNLGKVADQMIPKHIVLCQYIEEERVYIVVESFMIQK